MARLMNDRAPDWWYLTLFVISVSLGLATVLGYPSQLPWWTYFVSIILATVFVIPCWYVQSDSLRSLRSPIIDSTIEYIIDIS